MTIRRSPNNPNVKVVQGLVVEGSGGGGSGVSGQHFGPRGLQASVSEPKSPTPTVDDINQGLGFRVLGF